MARGVLPILFALYGLACGESRGPEQSTSLSSPKLVCDTCRIQFRSEALLGENDAKAPIVAFSEARTFHHGNYLVAPVGGMDYIALFAPAGNEVAVIGRSGEGPGEYRTVQDVAVRSDDSVVVLSQRLTLLTPDLSFARAVSFPRGVRASRLLPLPSGKVLLNNYSVPGRPFIVLDADLRMVRQVGEETSGSPEELQHVLASAGSEGFWSARTSGRYLIEHWSLDGKRIRTIQPKSAWFEAGELWAGHDPRRTRPSPRIGGIWLDNERLWVIGIVSDIDWKPQLLAAGDPHVEVDAPMPQPEEWPSLFDTMVEVLDLRTGAVMSTRRYDGVLMGFMDDGKASELISDAVGLKIRIISLHLGD